MRFKASARIGRWASILLIWAMTLLVWGQTIRYDFVWDDQNSIVENESIRYLRNIPAMFFSKEMQGIWVFRPLRTVHYAILNGMGGSLKPRPWIYHLTNIVWHATAATLFYLLLTGLFTRSATTDMLYAQRVACLFASGFAVHPVTSEVVCWAKSLDDILATVFTLAASIAISRQKPSRKNVIVALVWFTLALYAKESSAPFSLLSIFIFRVVHRCSWRSCLGLSSAFFVVAAVYCVHRHLVMGGSAQCAPISGSYLQTLIDTIPAAREYLRLLLGIPPFCADYSFLKVGNRPLSGNVVTGALILLLLIGLIIWAWQRDAFRVCGFGLLWLGAFLLPVSNVVPMMQYMAERFLYLPLLGFFMALGSATMSLTHAKPRSHLLVSVSAAGVLVLWTGASWVRMSAWRDDVTLFLRTCSECPKSARSEKNAVSAILSLPHMRAAFLFSPESSRLEGVGKLRPENAGPVVETLLSTDRLFPGRPDIALLLGIAYGQTRQSDKAVPFLQFRTGYYPTDPSGWVLLANAYADIDDWIRANDAIEMASRLSPNRPDIIEAQYRIASVVGEYGIALNCATRLQVISPNADHERLVFEAEEKLRNCAGGTRDSLSHAPQ